MNRSSPLIVCFVILCGCTHDHGLDLKQLATGVEQPWPGSRMASMTMMVRESGGHPVLHCRLQNPSSNALAVDRSRLPWKQPIYFIGAVVTSTGRTFAIGPVGVLAYIVGEPQPFLIAPGGVVEGDFELRYLPKNPMAGPPIPRDQDMLLLWSYELPIYGETLPQESSKYDGQMRSARLVGITFLSKHAIELLDK